jgi:hypothetical protein
MTGQGTIPNRRVLLVLCALGFLCASFGPATSEEKRPPPPAPPIPIPYPNTSQSSANKVRGVDAQKQSPKGNVSGGKAKK